MRCCVLVVLLLGCTECSGETALLVVVDTDRAVPEQMDRLRVRAWQDGGEPVSSERPLGMDGGCELPCVFRLVPESDGDARITVEVTGAGPELEIRRTVRTGFVSGRTKVLVVALIDDPCRPEPLDSDGADLPDYGGTVPEDRLRPTPCADGGMDGGAQDGGVDAGTDGGTAEGGTTEGGTADGGRGTCLPLDDDAGPSMDAGCGCGDGYEQCRLDGTDVYCVVYLGSPLSADSGRTHSCATGSSGRVMCWGEDNPLLLGGDPLPGPPPPRSGGSWGTKFAIVAGIDDALQVSVGARHSCVVHDSGDVSCWGATRDERLGGVICADDAPGTVPLPAGALARGVTAGARHTCAWTSDERLFCWGHQDHGQLGLPEGDPSGVPVPVAVAGVVSASAGEGHTCVVTSDGSVHCFGDASSGQLGHGSTAPVTGPVAVDLPEAADQVGAGSSHSCALLERGSVMCWGDNSRLQLGDAAHGTASPEPVMVPGVTGAVELAVGDHHACVRLAVGSVICWGDNSSSQAGAPPDAGTEVGPTTLECCGYMARLAGAGASHTCAIPDTEYGPTCWGDDSSGQLGRFFPSMPHWSALVGVVRADP